MRASPPVSVCPARTTIPDCRRRRAGVANKVEAARLADKGLVGASAYRERLRHPAGSEMLLRETWHLRRQVTMSPEHSEALAHRMAHSRAQMLPDVDTVVADTRAKVARPASAAGLQSNPVAADRRHNRENYWLRRERRPSVEIPRHKLPDRKSD